MSLSSPLSLSLRVSPYPCSRPWGFSPYKHHWRLLVSTIQSIKLYAQFMFYVFYPLYFTKLCAFRYPFFLNATRCYHKTPGTTRNRSASCQVSRASGLSAKLDQYLAEELSFISCQENGLSLWISRSSKQAYSIKTT